MAVTLSLFAGAGAQFFDNNGVMLSGGLVYTYGAGTTTPLAAYTSNTGATALSNPIVLDASGRVPTGEIWLTYGQGYKFTVKTSTGTLIGTYDNIPSAALPPLVNDAVSIAYEQGASVTAGNFIIGQTYLITFIGSTNFQSVGAVSNTVGIYFTATGVGSGTGTAELTRTVQAKLRETVSVKDFGAIGNGVIDDTAAFAAAIASSATHIFVPQGTYLISSTLSIAGKTLSGPEGGSQHFQSAYITHSASSTGPLFSVAASAIGTCIKNLSITGGNGSFCISSSDSYVRYEYLVMEPYNGGGIQLLYSGMGSSSSKLINCEWVGPPSATAYTGYEIDVNGGDIRMEGCTAIRGAIGINIIRGQTVYLDGCSLTKQTRNPTVTGGPFSSASQFNTAAIKLTGAGLKQAISIRNCYLEVCDNQIYVESCESLSIEDNHIDDGGAAGVVGTFIAYGNSAIYLADNTCKNVTIKNNNIQSNSAGSITGVATNWFALRLNSASNVMVLNNIITTNGDYSAAYYVTTSQTVYILGNTLDPSNSFPVSNYDPNNLIRTIAYEITGTFTPALSSVGATFSYAVQQGFYKKVGDLVWFSLEVQLNTSGNTLTSNGLLITGLPFASLNTANQRNVVNAIFSGLTSASSLFASGVVLQGDTRIQLYSPVTTGTSLAVITSNFLSPTAGGFIAISGWYKAQA